MNRKSRPWAAYEGRLRELHGRGLSAAAIARETGLSPGTVRTWIVAIGLVGNFVSGGRPRRGRAAARRDAEALRRRLAADAAYPGCLTAAEARVCRALMGGPLSLAGLAAACGMAPRAVRLVLGRLSARGMTGRFTLAPPAASRSDPVARVLRVLCSPPPEPHYVLCRAGDQQGRHNRRKA